MAGAPDLFTIIDHYIDDLFVHEDAALVAAVRAARGQGLPDIQVSRGQGKFLYLLAKIVGARTILEIGTLAGYSTIWLARALPPDGRLVTLEANERHADVARENIARAGLAERVELVVGDASDTLPRVLERLETPIDVVFLDADKTGYPAYLSTTLPRLRSGALLLADNIIRAGTVLAPRDDDPSSGAARAFNALIAADARLESIVLQQVGIKGHDGLAIARVRSASARSAARAHRRRAVGATRAIVRAIL